MKMNWKPKLYVFKSKKKELRSRKYYRIVLFIQCCFSFAFIITGIMIFILKPDLISLGEILELSNHILWFMAFIFMALIVLYNLPRDLRFSKSICSKCSLFNTRYCPSNVKECPNATNKPILFYKGNKYE